MKHSLKFDIQVDNFNGLFTLAVSQMTTEQKRNLPPEILAKLFKISGQPSQKKLNFLQQLYVLCQGGGKEVYVVVGDEEKGIGIADFEKFKREQKRHKISQEAADYYLSKGVMVLGNRELMDWLSYLNSVSISPAYKYALSLKNVKAPKIKEVNKEFSYFCNLIMTYEGNKKRIVRQEGITIPELYILLYLSDGKEKRATASYVEVYRNSVNASRKQLLEAFKKLVMLGYAESFGKARATNYRISAKGKEKLYGIIHKHMIA